jgi:hypothetical protein
VYRCATYSRAGPPHQVELARQVERDGADRGGKRQPRVLAVVEQAADRPEHLVALAELDPPLRLRRRRDGELRSAACDTESRATKLARTRTLCCGWCVHQGYS